MAPAKRLILNLKPRSECVEGLRRYCAFFDVTMTGFLSERFSFSKRQLLERLTIEQRQLYLNNALTLADMSEADQALFNGLPSVALASQPGAAT